MFETNTSKNKIQIIFYFVLKANNFFLNPSNKIITSMVTNWSKNTKVIYLVRLTVVVTFDHLNRFIVIINLYNVMT